MTTTTARGAPRIRRIRPRDNTYDAFISYSHKVDSELAVALQRALHQFARPRNQLRAVRVFRDEASLAADPGLRSSIQAALDGSRFLILLASPQAAASPWVEWELSHWLATKSSKTILIAITRGKLAWRDRGAAGTTGDFHWSRTTPLPKCLRGRFAEEPRVVDLTWVRTEEHRSLRHHRFQDAVATLAAPLHGKAKDELTGEDVRQHRRRTRNSRIVKASLACLAALTTIFMGAFLIQRNEARSERNQARAQRNLATSREFAALAATETAQRPARALLESLQALRTANTAEARAALANALQQGSALRRYLPASAPAWCSAITSDGAIAAVGSADGTITLWNLETAQQVRRAQSDRTGIEALGFDRGGRYLSAVTGDGILWRWEVDSGRVLSRSPTRKATISSAPFSPDGSNVALSWFEGDVTLWDVERRAPVRPILKGQDSTAISLAFSGDGRSLAAEIRSDRLLVWSLADPHARPRDDRRERSVRTEHPTGGRPQP